MRYFQQAESSAIRLPIVHRSDLQVSSTSMYTLKPPICIPMTNWRSANLRSALESFSQPSHPCGCGAFRFLLWWLFLHRRLRSGNEAQLSLSRFAPFGGSLPPGATRFYPNGLRKSRNLLLQSLSAPTRASIEVTAACFFSLSGVTAPIADPFVGLESRDLRDRVFILLHCF